MSSGDWFDKLAWVQQGYAVAAMDVRGQGGLSEDNSGIYGTTLSGHIIRGLDAGRPERLFYRNVFLDAAQLVRTVATLDEVNEERLFTFGGSQGAASRWLPQPSSPASWVAPPPCHSSATISGFGRWIAVNMPIKK